MVESCALKGGDGDGDSAGRAGLAVDFISGWEQLWVEFLGCGGGRDFLWKRKIGYCVPEAHLEKTT